MHNHEMSHGAFDANFIKQLKIILNVHFYSPCRTFTVRISIFTFPHFYRALIGHQGCLVFVYYGYGVFLNVVILG